MDLGVFRTYVELNRNASRGAAIQTTDTETFQHGVSFKRSDTDHAWAVKRSHDDKILNNKIRAKFLNAIFAQTGLKLDQLPKEVRSALQLDSYAIKNRRVTSGKPLTIYRMTQVFKALDKNADKIKEIKAKIQNSASNVKSNFNNNIMQDLDVENKAAQPVTFPKGVDKFFNQQINAFEKIRQSVLKGKSLHDKSTMLWINKDIEDMKAAYRSILANPTKANLEKNRRDFSQAAASFFNRIYGSKNITINTGNENKTLYYGLNANDAKKIEDIVQKMQKGFVELFALAKGMIQP